MSLDTNNREAFHSPEQFRWTETSRVIDVAEVSRILIEQETRQENLGEHTSDAMREKILEGLGIVGKEEGVLFTEQAKILFDSYIRASWANRRKLAHDIGISESFIAA